MPSNYMIIEAIRSFTGQRFDTRAGERRRIRFGYDNPSFIPRIVAQCRNSEAIDWGGAAVQPQDYKVIFDGPGPLPAEYREAQ